MLGGIVAVPGPGPGWVIIFLGLGMIVGEFRPAARFLDWVEVRARRLARWSKDAWTNSPIVVRVSVALITLICAAAFGYGAYYLGFGG